MYSSSRCFQWNYVLDILLYVVISMFMVYCYLHSLLFFGCRQFLCRFLRFFWIALKIFFVWCFLQLCEFVCFHSLSLIWQFIRNFRRIFAPLLVFYFLFVTEIKCFALRSTDFVSFILEVSSWYCYQFFYLYNFFYSQLFYSVGVVTKK